MKGLSAVLLLGAISMMLACDRLSPMEYNEKIVSLHDGSWRYLSGKYSQLYSVEIDGEQSKAVIDSMNMNFENILHTLDSIKYPCQAADFHRVTVRFFEFVKDSVVPLYEATLGYEPESSQWYDAWGRVDYVLNGRVSQLENDIISEQTKFAKKISISY